MSFVIDVATLTIFQRFIAHQALCGFGFGFIGKEPLSAHPATTRVTEKSTHFGLNGGGEEVSLDGRGAFGRRSRDDVDADYSAVWRSSIDGNLGNGQLMSLRPL